MDNKIKKALTNNRLLINLIRQLDEELYEENHNVDSEKLVAILAEAIDANYDSIYAHVKDELENEL